MEAVRRATIVEKNVNNYLQHTSSSVSSNNQFGGDQTDHAVDAQRSNPRASLGQQQSVSQNNQRHIYALSEHSIAEVDKSDGGDGLSRKLSGMSRQSSIGKGNLLKTAVAHRAISVRSTDKLSQKKDSIHNVLRKKDIYFQLSFIFGIAASVIVAYEYVSIFMIQTPPATSTWLILILVLQSMAFYLCLLSFIYANEAGDTRRIKWTVAAAMLNLMAFILRITLNLRFSGYFPDGIENIV